MAERLKILGGHPYLVDDSGNIRPEPEHVMDFGSVDEHIYDYVTDSGQQYAIHFSNPDEMMRFEESLERFFMRTGRNPNNLNKFFVEEGINPDAIDDHNPFRTTSHRRGANDMAFHRDSFGNLVEDKRGRTAQDRSRVIDQEQRQARRTAEVATVDPTTQIQELLASTGALPTNKPLHEMTSVEQAMATATGLAQLVNLAAANLAAAKAAEEARGQEPPAGAVARFSKHFGGPESKQYNFTAIRVEKTPGTPNASRAWHHSGVNSPVHLGSHLSNPCSWEELNEFADEGSVEVGMEWAKGPEWESWEALESTEGAVDTEVDAQVITALYDGLKAAQSALAPYARPGVPTNKGVVKSALSAVDKALNEHDKLVLTQVTTETDKG